MENDTVRAFINGRVEQSSSWWHSNGAIWNAYFSHCEEHGATGVVGGANALIKYLNSQLDFPITDARKVVGGERQYGKTGLYVEGAPGILLEDWRGNEVGVYFERTHDGLPVLEVVDVEEYRMMTEPCPACGEQHTHGREPPLLDGEIEFSHRASHCPTDTRPSGYYLAVAEDLEA